MQRRAHSHIPTRAETLARSVVRARRVCAHSHSRAAHAQSWASACGPILLRRLGRTCVIVTGYSLTHGHTTSHARRGAGRSLVGSDRRAQEGPGDWWTAWNDKDTAEEMDARFLVFLAALRTPLNPKPEPRKPEPTCHATCRAVRSAAVRDEAWRTGPSSSLPRRNELSPRRRCGHANQCSSPRHGCICSRRMHAGRPFMGGRPIGHTQSAHQSCLPSMP